MLGNSRTVSTIIVCLLLSTSQATAAARPATKCKPTICSSESSPVLARNASLILKVQDYQAARSEVMNLAVDYGAQMRQARTTVNELGQKHGEFTLQVDEANLAPFTEDLRKIGRLYSENIQTTDQTSQYETLGRRIGLLGQNESELLSFLRTPKRMRGSDILFVQYRLYQSRVEASDAALERLNLARSANKSLVRVELFEPEGKRSFNWRVWHAHAIYRAKGAFLGSVRKVVTGLYYLLWFAPLWLPAAVVLALLYRYLRRKVRELVALYRSRRQVQQDTSPG